MSNKFVPVLPFLLAAFLISCASYKSEEEEMAGPEMTIKVDFQEVHLCSRISPEITVAYAPEGTKFYDVRLFENGAQDRYLGGGTWDEDGTGIIPEGALTRHYSGPCPPKDKKIEYTYVVTAMEDETSQPLAVRLYKWFSDN